MNLKLKTVTSREEAAGLTALLEQAVRDAAPGWSQPAGPEVAGRYLGETLGRPGALLIVAEQKEAGRPLALAASAPLADPLTGERVPLLVLLHVDPSIRQRGVARELVRELRRQLTARGQSGLWARVGHNDDALISMGERWGFVRDWELMSAE